MRVRPSRRASSPFDLPRTPRARARLSLTARAAAGHGQSKKLQQRPESRAEQRPRRNTASGARRGGPSPHDTAFLIALELRSPAPSCASRSPHLRCRPMTDPKDHDEGHDDELDEDEDEEDESPPPPKAKAKPSASVAKSSAQSAKVTQGPALTPSHWIGIAIAALAVGGAAGWFGHIEKGKAALRADLAAAPAGSGVPAGPVRRLAIEAVQERGRPVGFVSASQSRGRRAVDDGL